jgi:predicted CopG family antitoxin
MASKPYHGMAIVHDVYERLDQAKREMATLLRRDMTFSEAISELLDNYNAPARLLENGRVDEVRAS